MEGLIAKIMDKNDFPQYSDGDVLIVIRPGLQYQLHSHNLCSNSDVFQKLLTEDSAANLAPKIRKNGNKTRWRVELQLPDEDEDGVGKLVIRQLTQHGQPKYASAADHPSATDTEPPLLHHHYDNLLKCLYHRAPKISISNLKLALRDVVGLTDVAENLGSIPCVSNSMDLALVNQGPVLYQSIAAKPTAWAELAVRIRSELILREAACHLVGNWTYFTTTEEGKGLVADLPAGVRQLCERKAHELDEKKKAIELRILGHYPAAVQTLQAANQNVGAGSRTIRGAGTPTRAAAYTSKAMDWMALNLFRHWLGQSIAGEMSRKAPDGGAAFYTAISKGGEEYIDQNAREAFTQHFPMSAKARTLFDRALWEIKEAVKGYVGDLVHKACQLETAEHKVDWLVCTKVESEECPWAVEEKFRKDREGMFGVLREESRDVRLREKEAKRLEKQKRKKGRMEDEPEGEVDAGVREGWEMIEKRQRYDDRMKGNKGITFADTDPGAGPPPAAVDDESEEIDDFDDSATESDYGRFGRNAFATGSKRKRTAGGSKRAISSPIIGEDNGLDDVVTESVEGRVSLGDSGKTQRAEAGIDKNSGDKEAGDDEGVDGGSDVDANVVGNYMDDEQEAGVGEDYGVGDDEPDKREA